jgi:putative FmdB family regulatory protein
MMEVSAVPIYEYQCSKCGEVFEAFQKITDEPLSKCKFCNSRVEKLISHSSFQLKGSGWYLTDYAKGASPGSAGSMPKTSESSEKTTETKPSTEAKTTEKSTEKSTAS